MSYANPGAVWCDLRNALDVRERVEGEFSGDEESDEELKKINVITIPMPGKVTPTFFFFFFSRVCHTTFCATPEKVG